MAREISNEKLANTINKTIGKGIGGGNCFFMQFFCL